MLNYMYSTKKISADILTLQNNRIPDDAVYYKKQTNKQRNKTSAFSLHSTTTSVDAYQKKCIYLFVSSKVLVCLQFKGRVALPWLYRLTLWRFRTTLCQAANQAKYPF